MPKITKRTIAGLTPLPKGELFIWDADLRGFGVRVMPSGVATYLIQYRTIQGKSRRFAFARVGTLTLDQAKEKARRLLSETRDGSDPSADRKDARKDMTWAQVCDIYLEAARAGQVATARGRAKRASTVAIDEGRVARHMTPLIGSRIASSLNRSIVQRMYDDIAAGKTATVERTKARGKAVVTGGHGTAARVVELLGGIWTWADKRGLVAGPNPARGVDKIKGEARDRVLTPEELSRLGRTMRVADPLKATTVNALRLIALTGLRREEACALKWSEISFAESCLRLQKTKTGRSKRVIGQKAVELLKSIEQSGEYVFPSRSGKGSADLKKAIKSIFDAAKVDASSQDLRRTFASIADQEGYGVAAVGEMLGHARRGVTDTNYIRRPDATMIEAVTRVSNRIATALDGSMATMTRILFEHSH